MIKILISHPQTLFLQGMQSILKEHKNIKLVYSTNEVAQVCEYLKKSEVDIVITNVDMPGSSGINILRDIKQNKYPCRTILLANHFNPLMERVAYKEGAAALLDRACSMEDFIHTIQKVSQSNQDAKFLSVASVDSAGKLSKREVEVYLLLIAGMSLKDISAELRINEKTSSTYKKRLFTKLNVNSLVELLHLHSAIS